MSYSSSIEKEGIMDNEELDKEEITPVVSFECSFCFLAYTESGDRRGPGGMIQSKSCDFCGPKAKEGVGEYLDSEELLWRRLAVMDLARMHRLVPILRGAVTYLLKEIRHLNREIVEINRNMTDLTNEVWRGDGK